MKNIAIIGTGNIGRRHLQALSHLDSGYKIYAVDTSDDALNIATRMYDEIKNDTSPVLELYQNLNTIPNDIFTAIIATSSNDRESATKILIDKDVKYIIFEKVLFQQIDLYDEIETILNNKEIKAWVNCWRRSIPFYKKLKDRCQRQKFISMSVTGNNWGIASNTIHFLDLLNYLTGKTDYYFNDYDVELVKCKRPDYYEFLGYIKGTFNQQCSSFLFKSDNITKNVNFEILMKFENSFLVINDDEGWWYDKTTKSSSAKKKMKVLYQSEMTHIHILNLSEKGICDLTEYSDSSKLHLPMIKYFSNIFEKNGIFGCPIT